MVKPLVTIFMLVGLYFALPISVFAETVIVRTESPAPQSKSYGGMLHPTGVRPSFEVATIRQSAPDSEARFTGITMHSDVMEIRGTSIKDVIEFAYDVPNESEFSGGPSWIRTEKFDITAKPSEEKALTLAKLSWNDLHTQMRLMLQSLLEERLRLKVSFPARNLPLLVLTVAKGGFKCKNASPSSSSGSPPPPPPPPPPSVGEVAPPPGRELWRAQEMHWVAQRMPFPLIATWIGTQPELGGRTVVDRTGIKGEYDCEVSWAHEGSDVPGPSFFTAVSEQMGLRLHSDRGPVETIIVDHVERPLGN